MALTWTDVANLALSRLGSDLISSLEDGTQAAKYCSLHVDRVYKALLSSGDWAFARARATLARADSAPLFGFVFAYALPDDFIALSSLLDDNGNATEGVDADDQAWRLEGLSILTDATQVSICYIRTPDNPRMFPEWFTRAMVALLASELAVALARSESLRSILYQEGQILLRDALAKNADLGPAYPPSPLYEAAR